MSFFNTSKDFSVGTNSIKRHGIKIPKFVYSAIVRSVFLDYTGDGDKPFPPGAITAEPIGANLAGVMHVYPLDELNTTIPVVNEIVDIFTLSNVPFYRRKNFTDSINTSLVKNFYQSGVGSKPLPDSGLADYKTGVGGTNSNSTYNNGQGDVFKKQYVNRLKFYEGDTLIQSRFGQSIRFSAYNNELSENHPTIIIRNRESAITNTKKGFVSVLEDINHDGSTIAITSGKYKSKFIPGTINKSGKSDFKLKTWENNSKYAFESYPKELDGDQIIITSDRLIFSSRAKETIFFSKGWFGITTDSALSVDAQRGVTIVAHKGDIDFESKEGRINFNAGKSGVMHIGAGNGKELTPAVDGKRLVELLGKLIDEVQNLGAAGLFTPAGPTTGTSPVTIQSLGNIRNELSSLLSKTVWIAK